MFSFFKAIEGLTPLIAIIAGIIFGLGVLVGWLLF